MATLRELIIKISANSQSFQSEIARASRMGGNYYKTMQNGGRQAASASRESKRALAEVNAQLASVKSTALGMTGALAGAFATGHLINLADQWNMVNARLKQASTSTQDFTSNQAALMALSQRTGTAFADNAGLFARSAASLREYGYSSQDALKVTEALATGLKLSGAGVQESSSVITQFSQALAQGVLRGEEFNSVNENGDRVIRALAAGMGVARKDLKAMADDGKLTADKVVPALISQLGAMQKEFDAMPATVGGSVTKVQNAFQQWVGGINETSHVTATLSGTLDKLAGNIDDVATASGVLVAVGVARYFGNMASGAYSATAGLISAAKSEVALAEAQLRGTQIAAARARAAVYRAQQALVAARGTDTQAAAEKKLAATQAIVTRNIAARTAAQTTLNSVTAIGSRLMSGALGLVGGIPGMVLLAAGAWYTMYQNQEQARQSALQYASTLDDVVEKAKEMNQAQLSGAIADSEKSIDALKDKLSELKDRQAAAGAEVKKYTELARGMGVENDANNGYVINAAKAQREYNQITRDVSDTTDQLNRAVENQSRLQNELAGKVSASAAAFKNIQKELTSTYRLAESTAGMMATTIQFLNQVNQSAPKSPTQEIENEAYTKYIQQQKESLELLRKEGVERAKLKALQDATKSGAIKTDVSGNILPGQENQISQIQSNAASEYGLQQAGKDKNKKSDAQKIEESYKNITKQQREQIALSGQTTELAKMKYQVIQGELSTLSSIQKQELLRNAALIDQAEIRKKAVEYENGLIDSNANAKAANDANLIGFGEGSRVRARMQEMISIRREFIQKDDELRHQHQAGEIDDEFFNRAIALNKRYLDKRLSDQQMYYTSLDDQRNNWMGGMRDGFADWADEATDYATQASQGMKTAMSGAVGSITEMLNGNKNSWKDWGVSVLKIIQNVLVNMAVANAAQSASGVFGSLFSAGASAFSGAATSSSNAFTTGAYNNLSFNAQGGVYQSPSLSAYSGGVYSTPQLFAFAKGAGVFGEAGPEAIMPLTRTANGSLGVRAIMPDTSTVNNGGNVYVTINENGTSSISGNGDQDFARTFTKIIQEEYRKLREKDLGQGGVLTAARNGRRGR